MFIKEMQHLATGMQPAFLSKNFAKIPTLRTFVGLLKLGSREKNPMEDGGKGKVFIIGSVHNKGWTYTSRKSNVREFKNWLEMG